MDRRFSPDRLAWWLPKLAFRASLSLVLAAVLSACGGPAGDADEATTGDAGAVAGMAATGDMGAVQTAAAEPMTLTEGDLARYVALIDDLSRVGQRIEQRALPDAGLQNLMTGRQGNAEAA